MRESHLNARNGGGRRVYHIETAPITSPVQAQIGYGQLESEDILDMVLDTDGKDARFYLPKENVLFANSVADVKAWLIARAYCEQ